MEEKIRKFLETLEVDQELVSEFLKENKFGDFISKEEVDSIVDLKTKEIAINSKVESELVKRKAKNIKACTALIDFEQISFENGEIKGLDAQIETIMSENSFLFEEDEYTPSSGINKRNDNNMTDKEYFEFLKLNNGGY